MTRHVIERERTVVVREWSIDAAETISLLRDLPTLLRDVRQARGLSLREVARQSGVSNSRLSQVERGLGEASLRTAIAILEWLTKVTAS